MADSAESDIIRDDAVVEADSFDKDSAIIPNEDDSIAADGSDEKQGSTRLAQLPHTRVRNMMKLDGDLHIASQDSVFLVTKAASHEAFDIHCYYSQWYALLCRIPDYAFYASIPVFGIRYANLVELFIQFFATEAHRKSVQSKRKTIQKRDLDSVIGDVDSMAFLEGALE